MRTKIFLMLLLGSILFVGTFVPASVAKEAKVVDPLVFQNFMKTILPNALELAHGKKLASQSPTESMQNYTGVGTIEGHVYDTDGNPLKANVFCWSLGSGFATTASVITDESGFYQFTDLGEGDYYLIASANGYKPQLYDHTLNPRNAKPVSIKGDTTVTDIDFNLSAAAGGTNSISGTVTDESTGDPIANAWIIAYGSGNPLTVNKFFTLTDEAGNYELTGLPAGMYFIFVQAKSYLPEFYDNVTNPLHAKAIIVNNNDVITGIDIQLSKGGSISGMVTDGDGNAIQGVKVTATPFTFQYSNTMMFLSPMLQTATTDENGQYKIEGLATGQYRVTALLRTQSMPLILFYDNTTDYQAATPVQVNAGEETTGIDFTFAYQEPTGVITGKVTDENDNPLAGVRIITWSKSDSFFSNFLGAWNTAQTDANGEYRLEHLWPGSYYVGAVIWNWTMLQAVWYDGADNISDATPVPVENDSTSSGIDFKMKIDQYGSISGQVVSDEDGSPVSYAYVEATPVGHSNKGRFRRPLPIMMAFTDSEGKYKIDLLAEGQYYVSVRKNGYMEYYDDAATKEEATPVDVTAGEETGNIDFSIPPFPATGSRISGTVTDDSTGEPIGGALVSIFPTIDNESIGHHPGKWWASHFFTTFSDENGNYIVGGIPQGTYVVSCWARDYLAEFYDDQYNPWNADKITLDGTEEKTGIDFALTPGWGFRFDTPMAGQGLGTVSGVVKSQEGYEIEGSYIYALDENSEIVASERSGANGAYTLGGLPEGKYYIMASRMPYTTEYYNDATDLSSATPVEVGQSDEWDVKDVDFTLSAVEVTSVEQKPANPDRYVLEQNYPNPFNPSTVIEYYIPKAGTTKLEIYNLKGQLVKSLVHSRQTSGWHKVEWDGKDTKGNPMPSGIYLYKMQSKNFTQTNRLVLMK